MRLLTGLLLVFLVTAAPLHAAEEQPEAREPRVYIRSGDSLHGTDLEVTDKAVLIGTPYSTTVKIDRRAVVGIAFGPGHEADVRAAKGEHDVLYLSTGDKISGTIIKTAHGQLLINAVYAGGEATDIALVKIDYLAFAEPGPDDALELKPDPVRVIFANGDLVSGTLAGFKSGTFRLDTQYAGTLRFTADDMQSLHNAEKSRQLFTEGLAEALMNLIEQTDSMQQRARDIMPPIVEGFLKRNDIQSALYVFRRMARYNIDPYFYRQLAQAFENAKQPDAAIEAYERRLQHKHNHPQFHRELFQAYMRHGRYARAAEIYETLLKEPPERLARANTTAPEIRMALADVYTRLEEHDKAIAHLRTVIEDPATRPSTSQDARTALIECFKKIDKLDELIATYTADAAALDDQLGRDYLALIREYIDRGRLAKARRELERLQYLSLDDYVARAKALLDEAYGTGPDNETENDTDDDED